MPRVISDHIKRLVIRHRDKPWTAAQMRERLAAEIEKGVVKGELPSERWIQDTLKKARADAPQSHVSDTIVRWPQSFDDGLLPWGAAPVLFELRRYLRNRSPLLPLMTCFWHITQACPNAPTHVRVNLAQTMAIAETLIGQESHLYEREVALIEHALLLEPWRSPVAMESFVSASGQSLEAATFLFEDQQDFVNQQFDANRLLVRARTFSLRLGMEALEVKEQISAELEIYILELIVGVLDLGKRDEFFRQMSAVPADSKATNKQNVEPEQKVD